ncbi:MAG: hypothetical protein IJK51_01620 [Bacteroidaceae bacterium]|nr:hypothetical protein [Bacteroidaceae bacterium]
MKIAIHKRLGSFSDRWIPYCEEKGLDYKVVNAYDSDIVSQVVDCDFFMWHFHHCNYRDMQFAKALILSLEAKGIRCFPNSKTCWYFDNKVWEKYILEAVNAPLVPSYIFYTEKEAMKWADKAEFPKVFKLKGGAGASNVKLVNTYGDAKKIIHQCFAKGFSQYRWQDQLKEEWRKYKERKAGLRNVIRPFYYALKANPTEFSHYNQKEIGYAFFQDFIPNNDYDIRIIVIGNKAFAIKRIVRKDDFRASGSGNIIYEREEIPEICVRISFDVSKKLKSQCLAYDYVFDAEGKPLIVEISYGFAMHGYDPCPGYWTEDMLWHEGPFNPQEWMVDNLLSNNA